MPSPLKLRQGVKNPREAHLVKSSLESLPFMEIEMAVWQKAGETSAELRREGLTIPLSDIIIASAAIIGGCEVFTLDPHFDRIQGVKLHRPNYI